MTTKTTLQLPATFTDTTLPTDGFDPVAPLVGGMILIDPMHPVNPWAAGVPANAAEVPNLLAAQAAPIVGLSASVLNLTVARAGLSGALGLAERTTKGGLHVISSQSSAVIPSGTADTNYFRLAGVGSWFSNWLQASAYDRYINASLYVSQWLRITRFHKTGGAATATLQISASASPTANRRNLFHNTNEYPNFAPSSAGALLLGTTDAVGHGTNGAKLKATGSKGHGGSATALVSYLFLAGNTGGVNTFTSAANSTPSVVLYRTYVENLDVSGRTYATVFALDQAQFTKDVLTAGGRYYGDTYTDPATIA
jgi:hypothetical protein